MDGPSVPPRMRATRLTSSTSSTPASRRRSRLNTGRDRSRHSTPPTTEVPPPKGTTATPSVVGPVQQGHHVLLRRRLRDDVGGIGEVAAQRAHHVPEGLAVRVADPGLDVHCAQMCHGGARPYRGFWQHQIGQRRYRREVTVERHQRPDSHRQGGQLVVLHGRVCPAPAPPRPRSTHGGQATVPTSRLAVYISSSSRPLVSWTPRTTNTKASSANTV